MKLPGRASFRKDGTNVTSNKQAMADASCTSVPQIVITPADDESRIAETSSYALYYDQPRLGPPDRPNCLDEPIFVSANLNEASDALVKATTKLREERPGWVKGTRDSRIDVALYDRKSRNIMSRVFIKTLTRGACELVPIRSTSKTGVADHEQDIPEMRKEVSEVIKDEDPKTTKTAAGRAQHLTEKNTKDRSQGEHDKKNHSAKSKAPIFGLKDMGEPSQQEHVEEKHDKEKGKAKEQSEINNAAGAGPVGSTNPMNEDALMKPPKQKKISAKNESKKDHVSKSGRVQKRTVRRKK